MKIRLLALLLTVAMLLCVMPTTFAADMAVPTLIPGVAATKIDTVAVNYAYNLTELQNGLIFEAPDGQELTYTSYYYERSADGGKTWSENKFGFSEALFGSTMIQVTETEAGEYAYRFYATTDGGKTFSSDTWTVYLTVSDDVIWDVTFHVGKDYNYSNTSMHPQLQVWRTAGVTEDLYDYVGWYKVEDGTTYYVTEPADYEITENAGMPEGWQIRTQYGNVYALYGYEPVTFCDSSFGQGAEDAVQSGAVVNDYAEYYASLPTGKYSYRAYGYNAETQAYDIRLGGMSIGVPADTNVDGGTGGGTELYIRQLSLYSNSLKSSTAKDYFDADSYYTEVNCPIMGCNAAAGAPYIKGNYTYYPYMVYAAGNACLYNYYAYSKTDYDFEEGYENWMFARSGNATVVASASAATANLPLKTAAAKTFTVPSGADFGIYYQLNNFNTYEMEPIGETEDNGTTATYTYMIHASADGNYTWRLSDPTGRYVTMAGWGYPAEDMTAIWDGAETNHYYHGVDKLGTQTDTRDEADLMVNVDPTGFTTISEHDEDKDGDVRIRSYRFWQPINSDAGNIMVEPDYTYTLLQGEAAKFETVDGGNTTGNWLDVATDGTVIGAVNYRAVDVDPGSYGTHGGFFPATDPHRTGVFIVSADERGEAVANVDSNGEGKVATTRPLAWDYNFDTWYYGEHEEAPVLKFTAEKAVKVEYATVMTDDMLESTISQWKELTEGENGYAVDLLSFRTAGTKGGTVIIRMTDAKGGVSYQNVRVAQMKITVSNLTNPGEPINPGNRVKLTFDGLYRGIHKISGIFNPTNFKLRYSAGTTEYSGTLAQYQRMDNSSVELMIPEDVEFPEGSDSVEYVISDGYTFGSMYCAANPFAFIYEMKDTGVGTNFNAVTVDYFLSKYADAVVEVEKPLSYTVTMAPVCEGSAVEGAAITITNANGTVMEPNANGTYTLPIGEYSYECSAEGYASATGTFRLGAATENVNGAVTVEMPMKQLLAGAWDGETMTEPQKDADGVYLISTGAELAWVANAVNTSTKDDQTYCNASYKLTNDIDLAGNPWTPIGKSNSNMQFLGTFDGCGYSVLNLLIDYDTEATSTPNYGLFGYVKNATVKNLSVTGTVNATSPKNVGTGNLAGIVGQAVTSRLENLHNYADVTVVRVGGNWANVGGVVGLAATGCEIVNCSNEGDVTAHTVVGGIAGYLNSGSKVSGSVNRGNIAGAKNIGGIVGSIGQGTSAKPNGTVAYCYNTGAISASTESAAGIAASMVGDISSGATKSYQNSLVSNCYNIGEVTAVTNAGGVASTMTGRASIQNAFCVQTTAVGYNSTKEGAVVEPVTKTLEQMKEENFVALLNTTATETGFIYNSGSTPALYWEKAAGEPETAYVAKIGDRGYETLAEAFEAAKTGDEIVALTKITVEGTEVWNLDGKTLSTCAVEDGASIEVKGDLTIEGGTFNVNGVYGIGVTGSLTVVDGTFNAAAENDYLIGNRGATTIKGGELKGIYCAVNNFAGTTTIENGRFETATGSENGAADILGEQGVSISGGIFSKPVSEEHCAPGYEPMEMGSGGPYGVIEKRIILGDVNGDSNIDSSDAVLILHAVSTETTDEILESADVNHDGKVDSSDVVLILCYVSDPNYDLT